MGILAYMRRNGLESQSCKGNQKLIIEEFKAQTTCHPSLVPREASAEMKIEVNGLEVPQ